MPFDGYPPSPTWPSRLADRIEYWRGVLEVTPDAVATIDFESRSVCNLKKYGAWIYSKHPTTQVMCLSYKLPTWTHVKRWHMAHPQHLISETPPPLELFAFVLAGGLLEAHNAFFERCIWKNIMAVLHGWPEVKHEQWRCSASRASAMSLPRDLEGAVAAMGLPVRKDMAGNALMRKMCKPRRMLKHEIEEWCRETNWFDDHARLPGKDNPALPVRWHEEELQLYALWGYCDQDVLAEEALSEALPELSEEELGVWQMDQWLNERGARFDLDLARAALDLADRWKTVLNTELMELTGIESGTKRQTVKDWLREHENLDLPDTKAETVEWYIEREDLSERALRVCTILMDVNRTSTRKYQAMLDKADPADWRVRDIMMYHGAGTGRWSGKGVQVHNFPARDLMVKDFDEAAELIKSGDLEWIRVLYGDVLKFLSHAVRGSVIPSEGRELMVADYAAIEARCVLWEADAEAALDVFRRGEDIYCDMASGIYGYKVQKGIHKLERQFGKQAILGLGYGMGFVTFLLMCRKYKIYFSKADILRIMGADTAAHYVHKVREYLCMNGPPKDMNQGQAKRWANRKRNASKVIRRLLEAREKPAEVVHELALMKYVVDVYRSRYPEVKAMWSDQEKAAKAAMQSWYDNIKIEKKAWRKTWGMDMPPENRDNVGSLRFQAGKVTWFVAGGFLKCELPSGRLMSYRSPELKRHINEWGQEQVGLRYMTVVNGKQWERTWTYGGKLVENITQAVARDIMARAMVLAHLDDTYDAIMSVHDELVCEVDEGKGSIEGFEELMSATAPWASGCPITAEAERYARYCK